jgi:hypothetical protein
METTLEVFKDFCEGCQETAPRLEYMRWCVRCSHALRDAGLRLKRLASAKLLTNKQREAVRALVVQFLL